jgi:Tol biopolymer transport system component
MRRGRGKMLLDEEHPLNTPEFSAASNRSTVSSRYSQSSYQSSYQSKMPTKPTETSRYGQTPSYAYRPQQSSPSVTTSSTPSSSYSRPSPYTKICSHCKRSVRNDQNICPYCDKRVR